MAHGKKIPPDMQWAILQLYSFLNTEQIAMCMGLSAHSVERIHSHFHAYGCIQDKDPAEEHKVCRNL